MRKIAFIDLSAQYDRLKPQIKANIEAVLNGGAYINGPEIGALEAGLSALTGAKSVVGCSSGTDALLMPLLAAGIGTGDAVFVPAFTYNATANAVLVAGAHPVFVDVDRETFTIDAKHLAAQIDGVRRDGRLRPRAVIPVDLFGLPADYDAIAPIAAAHELFVLADAAQSLGGRAGNKAVGTLAPVTATSFYPTKTLGGYGDGGAIFCQDPSFASVLQSIRWHGTDEARSESVRVGINGRLDSLQAAVLNAKLTVFEDEIARRRAIAAAYDQAFGGRVAIQRVPEAMASARALYCILVDGRDAVRAKLAEAGVPTAIYYAKPLHRHAAFAPYGQGAGSLPVSEALSARILALPLHPYLSDDDVAFVIDAVHRAVPAAVD